MLEEVYQKIKKKTLESIIVQREEQGSEQKALEVSLNFDAKSLKAKLVDKPLMQSRIWNWNKSSN